VRAVGRTVWESLEISGATFYAPGFLPEVYREIAAEHAGRVVTDQDPERHWEGIRQYEADIASGKITFGDEEFAEQYPGKDKAAREEAWFLREKLPYECGDWTPPAHGGQVTS
jgi:hypothetical protein